MSRPPGVRLPEGVRVAVLLAPALTVVAVFAVAGLGQALAQSLGYQPYLSGWRLSLDAYRALTADRAVVAAVGLTARVALLSTLLSAVAAIGLALLLRRLGRGRRWAALLVQANLAVPHLVGAVCMALLLAPSGLLSRLAHAAGLTAGPASFPELVGDRWGIGIVAEYVWKETPFLTVLALTALGRGADDLADAARVLGASAWQRLRRVTLPVVAPPVAAGSVLVLAFAIGSYEVPYLLGRPYPATLSVVAYQYATDPDLRQRPVAMAVAVVLSVAALLAAAGYLALVGRLARRAL
ncbi:ABC transporter permease [Nakamurella endophytica]|uniref:ABC transporter n=1 Tax=Nakamurella endophytica TaxID=1748367 RepID=A0A917WC61_9ACTN|nr:ABC transporter permease subunit [Nakamurella endophytica]GGL89079.1 ABC transporter [Nakamurella endophytica]